MSNLHYQMNNPTHGRSDIPRRIFNIKWIVEWDTYKLYPDEPGEVCWMSLDPPIGDGGFYIWHNSHGEGDFQLSILGGRGPGVYDILVDAHIPTLMEAMRRARAVLNTELREEEKLEKILEKEAEEYRASR